MSELTPANSSQFLVYQTEDGKLKIDVRFEGETVWLTQQRMAELFQTTKQNVSLHIQKVFAEGELLETSVVKDSLTTAADGKKYATKYYNLDVIISVGYRVKSQRGTQFRIWATQRLREYIVKGFVLDDERLKNPDQPFDYFEELTRRLQDIRTSERRFYQKITDIYATSIDYDPTQDISIRFFQTVQNKVHWAITGRTAAEIIHERVDAAKPNLGLTNASAFADRPWNQRVKNQAAMIARLDADVGRLMAKLKQLGIDDQTLVVFSSDNGADGPGRETFDGTAGLRGYKRHLYEGGIRALMIARWPGVIKADSESDLLTSQVDFLTTACDLAGVDAPPNIDGDSIAPTLLGKDQAARHRALYWEIYEGPHPFQQAVRMDRWKGYRTALEGPLELYNLERDPHERSNVAAKHADVVKQIEAIMAEEHVPNPNWRPTKNRPEAGKKNRRRAAA